MAARHALALPCVLLLCSCGGDSAVEITAGPYILDVGPTAVTIAWHTSAPADTAVECWTGEAVPGIRLDERTAAHEARLTGLEPNTLHQYRVRSGAARSAMHAFRTAPREPRPFRFVVCADTGGAPERLAAMAEAMAGREPAFVVHAGGYLGESRAEDAWGRQFFAPARGLLSRCPLIPAPSAEDGEAGPFRRLFPTASGVTWRSYRFLHVEVFALDASNGIAVGDEQYRWLEQALARSDAQWKVVVFHRPLFPAGTTRESASLRRALYPLLLRAHADLTVAAGDGLYARTLPIGAGEKPEHNALVNLLTSGGADAPEPKPEDWLARVAAGPHYLLVEADGEELTVQAIDLEGATLDAIALHKAGTLRQRGGALSAEALEGLLAFLPPDGLGTHAPGGTRKLRVAVANPYDLPIEGTLTWQTPGAGWAIEPASMAITVPPSGHRTFDLTVTAGAPASPPIPAFVAAGRRLEARRSPFRAVGAGR